MMAWFGRGILGKKRVSSSDAYRFFAFISYNRHDTKWGWRLQRRLEGYRIPTALCGEKRLSIKRMKPVFFAPTDIQPKELDEELKSRLRASRHLIVICSPHSAKSEWVGREIEYFHSLGRDENIHLFMVDGEHPAADPERESFNPAINRIFKDPLAANVNEKVYRWSYLNRQRAYIQLISTLLGVEFDTIWQRERRRMLKHAIAWTLLAVAFIVSLICVWKVSSPIDVRLKINEASVENRCLPPMQGAVASLYLDKEVKTDTLVSKSDVLCFAHVPHRFIGRKIRLCVQCKDFFPLDTMVVLSKNMAIGIRRDPSVYGNSKFYLYDDVTNEPLAGVRMSVGGMEAISDKEGRVEFSVPLDKQRKYYPLIIDGVRLDDSISFENFGKTASSTSKPIKFVKL